MCEKSTAPDAPDPYIPRNADHTVLYTTVAGSLETFLAVTRERERVVPRFVERELRANLA